MQRSRKFIDPQQAIRDFLPSLMMEPVQRLPRYRLLLLGAFLHCYLILLFTRLNISPLDTELLKFPQVISESDRQALTMANERLDRILKAAELAGLIVSGGGAQPGLTRDAGRRSVLVGVPGRA